MLPYPHQAGALTQRQFHGLGALSKVDIVAAGSGLMLTLVVHCAPHRASVLLDITRLPVSYILYPFNKYVLSVFHTPSPVSAQD